MNSQSSWIFKDESILDVALYKETCDGINFNDYKSIIRICILTVLLASLLIFLTINPEYSLACLFGITLGLIIRFVQNRRNKDGGKAYKKIIENNGGHIPHNIRTYHNTGITMINPVTRKERTLDYTHIADIIETDHSFVLLTDDNQFVSTDMRFLSGGSKDEFRAFLLAQCTNVKKGIRKGTFGKTMYTIYQGVSVLLIVVSVIFALLQYRPSLVSFSSIFSNKLSYSQAAGTLVELGIGLDDEILGELKNMDETPDNMAYYGEASTRYKMLYILCWEGMGTYNYETWEWTPSDSGVYWFDAEVFNVAAMYTDFLTGISALSGGELQFSNIRENQTDINWEKGTGIIDLSFDFEGETYEMSIPMDGDWISIGALSKISKIINNRNSEKQLYYASDSGQGFLVFYQNKQWAKKFEKQTGIILFEGIADVEYFWSH